ncbi:MAG TPA: DNA replication/repair protein RecF [Armatimonadota bacterium]|nr:DNA replication/repair protein RecF [Armatimonadota bacterium]
MHIQTLHLQNFRNYGEASIVPGPGLNVALGRNAQGKTSLLEAIYLLATARSWRAGRDSELMRWGAEHTRVSAEVARDERNDVEIEVVLGKAEKKQVRVNTIRQTRLSDLMSQMNVVLIEPRDVEIVRGEPSERRKFLNLEISQIQPQYCHLLVNYRRVLEQRNRLLRELQVKRLGDGELRAWDEQLVAYGARILERRLEFVRRAGALARIIHSQITDGAETLEAGYAPSLDLGSAEAAAELATALGAHLEQIRGEEIRRGMTLVGPQRDDVMFAVDGVDARVYGSHGQQRTIALSLRLAELELMEEAAGEPPIVLLDDVMTDLDEERRAHVFEMTRGRCQTFLTAANTRVLDPELLEGGRLFRVSGGQVIAE